MLMPPFYFWLGIAAIVGALYSLIRAQAADRRDWIIERATPLSIDLTNPCDDVWLSGRVECEKPLAVPYFAAPCAHYVYREEEYIRNTRSPHWRTILLTRNSTAFDLVDPTGRITVEGTSATYDGLQQLGPVTDEHDRRYSAGCLPVPGVADVVGLVSDDRKSLVPFANIPLIVTTRNRVQYIAECERREGWERWLGGALLLLGVFCLLLGINTRLAGPAPVLTAVVPRNPTTLLLGYLAAGLSEVRWSNARPALLVAFVVFAGWWFFFTYNLLVTDRERVKSAWRHIDIDLKNRHDLIPELVDVVKGYAQHERAIAEILTQLRYAPEAGVGLDRRESAGVGFGPVWAIAERNPELKASPVFAELRNQLQALETKIAFARQFYNDSLLNYDNARSRFPAVIVAKLVPVFPAFEPFESTPPDNSEP